MVNEIVTNSNVVAASPSPAPGSASDGAPKNDAAITATPAPDAAANASALDGDTSGNTGKNWEQEYQRARTEHETMSKRYADLRRKLDSQGAERNDYKRRFETLEATNKQIVESLRALTHKETYDPDQFLEEFKAQGPDYIRNLLQKERDSLLAGTKEEIAQMKTTLNHVLIDKAVAARMTNAAKYPNFKDLEEDMADIYRDNAELFDAKYKTVDEKIDALYNAAKLQRSPDAIKEAEARGRKKTEEELAREAHASVAGGGRVGNPAQADPTNMTAAQMKEVFKQRGMVSDGY